MTEYSEYIVYVDESGDHSLETINPEYPVFVLAFCIIRKDDYCEYIVPALQRLKFKHFGHDLVVLHESDIRKSRGPFTCLLNPEIRRSFLQDLARVIRDAPISLIASCILKEPFRSRRGVDGNPYHVAMEFGLERVFLKLQGLGQRGKLTHVIFEQRGLNEDRALELEFRRILDHTKMEGLGQSLDIVMANKQVNSSGLQLADMMARPIGRHLLAPNQANRAFDTLQAKFHRSPEGKVQGWGLKVYP